MPACYLLHTNVTWGHIVFEVLPHLAPDPILGLSAAFREDTNPNKIDLGVGVYKDEQGNTPILSSVAKAQKVLLDTETSKTYITPQGNQGFIDGMLSLLLGKTSPVLLADRVAAVQAQVVAVYCVFFQNYLPVVTTTLKYG